jgi:hypothetical protein
MRHLSFISRAVPPKRVFKNQRRIVIGGVHPEVFVRPHLSVLIIGTGFYGNLLHRS